MPAIVSERIRVTVSAAVAYAAGDVIGGKLSVRKQESRVSVAGKLRSLRIVDAANQSPEFDLLLFDSEPTAGTYTDNAAVVLSTDHTKCVAGVRVRSGYYFTAGGVAFGTLSGLDIGLGPELWVVLVAVSTPTFVATTDLTLIFELEE